MNAVQKHAWFYILVLAVTAVAVLEIVFFWGWGMAPAGMGMMGFMGFSALFYRKKEGRAPLVDERDGLIQMRAYLACFVLSSAFVIPAALVFVFAYGIDRSVPVSWVLFTAFLIGMFLQLVWASAVLIQYRGERGHDAS